MPIPRPTLLLLTLLLLGWQPSSAAVAAGIDWQPDLKAALSRASAENKVVFVALNMDHERANDQMVEVHYKDAEICRLAERTVALFGSRFDHDSKARPCRRAGVVTCAAHMAVEKAVRREVLPGEFTGEVIAPQHLFLDGEGRILLSVPYQITPGEMEWCLVTAIRKLEPEFAWKLSGSARPPRRLVVGGMAEQGSDASPSPPSSKEVVEIIARLKKVSRGEGAGEIRADINRLILSDDKMAKEFVKSSTRNRMFSAGGANRLLELIHDIGRFSSPEWWTVISPLLDDHRPEVRSEAAVALEQLAEPKSLNPLLKRWRKEDEIGVRKELIRAIAAVGPTQAKAAGLVAEQARKARDEVLRFNALIAAAHLEDRELVAQLVREALPDPNASQRVAAAYVVAVRREEELREPLEKIALLESEAAIKAALEAALDVLNGDRLERLDPLLRRFARSSIPRDRL